MSTREYKSNVFSMLMEDKGRALELYNAINHSAYDNPELVDIKTLRGGITLSIRNDAAFIVDARLSIYEHQSTVNPNMPLRSLIYFTSVIQSMFAQEELSKRNIYSKQLIQIPTPEFVVIYNGRSKQPAVKELKLSDAFQKKTDDPKLELKCTVYNVNDGMNEDLKEQCIWLDQYTTFVEKVREYHGDRGDDHLEADIESAIGYCIQHDILKDFLEKRRGEVVESMAMDFTFERQLELEVADARDEARAEGLEEGRAEGRAEGLNEGEEKAIHRIIASMYEKGIKEEQIAEMIDLDASRVHEIIEKLS